MDRYAAMKARGKKSAISSFQLASLNYTCEMLAKKCICLGGKQLTVPRYSTKLFDVGKGHVLSSCCIPLIASQVS